MKTHKLERLDLVRKKQRLDKLVAIRYHISRLKAKEYILNKQVKVGGKIVIDCSKRIFEEDPIELLKPLATNDFQYAEVVKKKTPKFNNEIFWFNSASADEKIWVLYEDSDLIVINKGRNILSHNTVNGSTSCDVSSSLCHEGYSLYGGLAYRKGIVHRLDKNTTGLMLITKNKHSYLHFSNMFKERTIIRTYVALVHNSISKEKFIIKGKIGCQHEKQRMAIFALGKDSLTTFERISNVFSNKNAYSLLACTLKTGRTHQIRVHLSAINHPIVGDKKYGRNKDLETMNICLHSSFMCFKYKSKTFVFVSTPFLPKVLSELKINNSEQVIIKMKKYLENLGSSIKIKFHFTENK